jgi:hypothetical protein
VRAGVAVGSMRTLPEALQAPKNTLPTSATCTKNRACFYVVLGVSLCHPKVGCLSCPQVCLGIHVQAARNQGGLDPGAAGAWTASWAQPAQERRRITPTAHRRRGQWGRLTLCCLYILVTPAISPGRAYVRTAVTTASVCPLGGGGTTRPSTGRPSTVSETEFPLPARSTEMW